jgi:hypothetical protein
MKDAAMRYLLLSLFAVLLMTAGARADGKVATLYKNPQCGCCEAYADYLRENGFEVKVVATHDLTLIKREHAVPEALDGCHTTLIDEYVIEGHVPVKSLNRLLTKRPDIDGISLPGMPLGSPGMNGDKSGPFLIQQFSGGETKLFYME